MSLVGQPGARVLWCLRRSRSDIRCVVYPDAMPIEVRILQDRDVVLRESFPEERLALAWAAAYGDQLRRHGWQQQTAADEAAS